MAMQLPQLWEGNQWTGIVRRNKEILLACGRGRRDMENGCYWPAKLFAATTASYAAPMGEFSIDFGRREVRFPINVSTTLGLSSSTYAWLSLIGIILAGGLGSGWLFKILEVLRARTAKVKHVPIRRSDR
jgi:hypothetical protein